MDGWMDALPYVPSSVGVVTSLFLAVTHKVTVVGDLHGSLVDLAKLLELSGFPSPSHT